jgi:hypothetical protein
VFRKTGNRRLTVRIGYLCDGEGLVEVTQGVQLPLLPLHGNVELPDTLEGELLLLDEDADGVAHEAGGHLQHLGGHRRRQQDHLEETWISWVPDPNHETPTKDVT